MTLREIVNKYPIINTNWECSNYVGAMSHHIMMVTGIHRYDTLNPYLGISEYFSRIRKDDGTSVKFNRDPWMRAFKMYFPGVKNGIYECMRINGVNGGDDIWITVTSVEGSRVWCMDIFER